MLRIEEPFRKFFDWLKTEHPNWYSIIIAIAVLLWVNGFIGLVDYYIVHPNLPLRNMIILSIGLLIIYLNDGNLSELHSDNDTKIKKMMEWAAVQSSATQSGSNNNY